MKKSHDQFMQEVADLTGGEYLVMGVYESAKTHIKMKHIACGWSYMVTPNKFLRGRRCPRCARTTLITCDEFKNEVENAANGDYELVGGYVNAKTPATIRHKICGCEWKISPTNFRCGKRCPRCAGNKKKDHSDFVNEVFALVGSEYSVLGECRGSSKKVLMRHEKCGHEYSVAPDTFLHNHRCPACNESRGEKAIASYFEQKGINFIRQYKAPGCIQKRFLPFDFAINDGSTLIEYDGMQHFVAKSHFGGERGFLRRKHNDKIKNDYCEANGIKLIRIPYTVDNIAAFLEKSLNDGSFVLLKKDLGGI